MDAKSGWLKTDQVAEGEATAGADLDPEVIQGQGHTAAAGPAVEAVPIAAEVGQGHGQRRDPVPDHGQTKVPVRSHAQSPPSQLLRPRMRAEVFTCVNLL